VEVRRYNYGAQFGDEIEVVLDAMRVALVEGRYGANDDVAAFEREFATFLGATHARGVNTGTDALILALRALGVGPGDEVVTHANTFNATVAAICLVGAAPVLVDADPRDFLIDVEQVEPAITPRTRVLLPVHLSGRATEMSVLLRLAERHGLDVVEDAAQAAGAIVDGRRAGSVGRVGCFSFHPSKNLAAAGDGGMIVTGDDGVAEQVDRLRSLGQRHQNDHVIVGLNTRLHALQAIVLRHKLPRLDAWNRRRRDLARRYREGLSDLPGLRFQDPGSERQHVFHLVQMGSPARDELLSHLRAAGVDAVVRYPVPIHLQPAFADRGWHRGQFPVSERLSDEMLCLPIRPDMDEREVTYVVGAVRRFFGAS
jgi:dTDP-4-amino-4,6-dideoxygalactose transaminase